MAAGCRAPQLDGNLISLACHLVVPLCERGTIVACEAKSVCLHPTSLSDDAEAEFFLNDVAVEGPAGVKIKQQHENRQLHKHNIIFYFYYMQHNNLFHTTNPISQQYTCH